MNYTVYMHITPNNKKYIGITCRKPEYRWNNGKGYITNNHFYNAILKYEWDNIKHEILHTNLSKEDACKLEQELIKKYQTTNHNFGYNKSIGGECGSLGVKLSRETIKKRLMNRDYSTSWAKGQRFSKEHCRKISQSLTGKHHTEETKRKLSESHKGKTTWIKGKKMNDEIRAKESTPIICVETNVCYFGINEASRQTGIHHSNICNCLKGKREKAGGYHWKYYDDVA